MTSVIGKLFSRASANPPADISSTDPTNKNQESTKLLFSKKLGKLGTELLNRLRHLTFSHHRSARHHTEGKINSSIQSDAGLAHVRADQKTPAGRTWIVARPTGGIQTNDTANSGENLRPGIRAAIGAAADSLPDDVIKALHEQLVISQGTNELAAPTTQAKPDLRNHSNPQPLPAESSNVPIGPQTADELDALIDGMMFEPLNPNDFKPAQEPGELSQATEQREAS